MPHIAADKVNGKMAEYIDEREKAAGRRDAAAQAIKMMDAKKKAKAAVKKAPTKTVVTPGTKVSQGTIDKIKSMGMSAALKGANSANPETREGIRRLYGATRYNKAVGTSKPAAPKPTDSRFSGAKKADVKKPTDSRFMGMGAGKPKSSGSMSYTTGSAKNNKATYTTGSGVSSKASTPKATPAQKTKSLKKNPLVKFVTSRTGGKSGGYGNSK